MVFCVILCDSSASSSGAESCTFGASRVGQVSLDRGAAWHPGVCVVPLTELANPHIRLLRNRFRSRQAAFCKKGRPAAGCFEGAGARANERTNDEFAMSLDVLALLLISPARQRRSCDGLQSSSLLLCLKLFYGPHRRGVAPQSRPSSLPTTQPTNQRSDGQDGDRPTVRRVGRSAGRFVFV